MNDKDSEREAFEEAALELDVPEGVADAEAAVEMLRAWIADGALLVSLNPEAFEDQVGEWGRLLGQLAHHAARSAALAGHMSDSEALQAIRKGFEATLPQNQPAMSGAMRGRMSH
ncbi:MAG: DUF5076 domain-containing protein [Hyphomicrobium sp.]